MEYIGGYLALKLGQKYKGLGRKGGPGTGWIQAVSRGGLYTPSKLLTSKLRNWETEFNSYHGATLKGEHDPINEVTQIIVQKDPTVPKSIVQLYSRTRFYIRLSHLNNENKMKSFKKRYVAHVSKYKY